MKEFYPYIVLPQKVEKIMSEGIPLPQLPQLMKLPDPVRRKYFGTVIFILSLISFLVFNFLVKLPDHQLSLAYIIVFFIALFSLVASIFEFVQYSQQKKLYAQALKLYNENKEAFKKVKASQEKINRNNKDEQLVKKFQLEKTIEFFGQSYDSINAIHNEYSLAKKRFKLFLDEYFPDEVLDHVKVVHSAKNLEYVPDYVIKFEKPKLNLAIEIEEPYSLSNIPENIQKDYEAKGRIRQRFANELGWIVIVLSEEQSVTSPTECCKFIEDSIENIFGDIKPGDQFAHIKLIKMQKMLTGEERAHMKSTGYREKYLIEAGLMDDPDGMNDKFDGSKNENVKKDINKIINEHKSKEKPVLIETSETEKTEIEMEKPEEKKEQVENEQLMLIKRVAQKIKPDEQDDTVKEQDQEPIKYTSDTGPQQTEESDQTDQNLSEGEETTDQKPIAELNGKSEQVRHEDDILKDLYKALDKHSKRLQERREKRIRERMGLESNLEEDQEESMNKTEEEVAMDNKLFMQTDQVEENVPEILSKTDEPVKVVEVERPTENQIKEITEEEFKDELEEPANEELILHESNEKTKLEEEMEAKRKTEESLKIQNDLMTEEAQKNQMIIDEFREKIEGAVFDKAWDDLIAYCDDAIKTVPFWDWAYYRRSTAWGNKREFEKAIEDCTRAIAYNPSLADAYYNRGAARFFTGKYSEAADDYQKSIELNYVKRAEAYFNRGLCFQKMELRKKAYMEFMKAKEMGSKRAEEILQNEYE